MEKSTHELSSRVDGMKLSVLEIRPDSGKKLSGVIQIVHGMSEYKERYQPFMEYMADRGYACVIHDHRGHGKSVKSPKDLGYMYGGRGESLVEDVRLVNAYIRHTYPDLPIVLLGHSMGSLIARTYLKKHDQYLSAAIICGSPSKNHALYLGKAIAATQKAFQGSHHKSKLIEGLSFGSYAARFAGEKSRFAWTCSDPQVVEEYDRSPLCGFTFTVDGYQALFDLMKETYTHKGWHCQNPNLPILFISGADDPCMGSVRQFKQAIDHMRTIGYHNIRGKLYPQMRHEILNETNKEKVYQDIQTYLTRNLHPTPKSI